MIICYAQIDTLCCLIEAFCCSYGCIFCPYHACRFTEFDNVKDQKCMIWMTVFGKVCSVLSCAFFFMIHFLKNFFMTSHFEPGLTMSGCLSVLRWCYLAVNKHRWLDKKWFRTSRKRYEYVASKQTTRTPFDVRGIQAQCTLHRLILCRASDTDTLWNS